MAERAKGQIAIYGGLLAILALRLHSPNEGLFYGTIKIEGKTPQKGEKERGEKKQGELAGKSGMKRGRRGPGCGAKGVYVHL